MDPALLVETKEKRAHVGRLPKAVVLVHLYGQSADIELILRRLTHQRSQVLGACQRYEVALVDAERAAEALGATYTLKGTFGKARWAFFTQRAERFASPWGTLSFNGNKIITTSGGGMLVSDDGELPLKAQARSERTISIRRLGIIIG